VKNYLFSKADNPIRMRDLEARWTQMMATLANAKADKFLSAFWTSRHGRIRSTDLYEAFKREYANPQGVIECSMDLVEAAEQYIALENSEDPVWAPFNPVSRERVRSLSIIGSQPTHPVILAALKKFTVSESERLLQLLESLVVRYQLIGGGNTGRFETTCATVAREIFKGNAKSSTEVFEQFKEIYPSDDEFKASFRIKSGLSNQKAQYILRGLEKESRRLSKGVMAQELQPGVLTVEHVLPKGGGNEWAAIIAADTEIVEDCVDRLGNLCLLTEVNRDLGRKSFEDKKVIYTKSELELTRQISSVEFWDRKAVDHRQAAMAKLAAQAWRFQ
jgi:hypothetical protein